MWDIPQREVFMELAINIYDSKVDSKNRITLRKARFDYYNVKEFSDGKIVLEPRVLVPTTEVSENTLKAMDKAISNFKKGKVSKPIKLK